MVSAWGWQASADVATTEWGAPAEALDRGEAMLAVWTGLMRERVQVCPSSEGVAEYVCVCLSVGLSGLAFLCVRSTCGTIMCFVSV